MSDYTYKDVVLEGDCVIVAAARQYPGSNAERTGEPQATAQEISRWNSGETEKVLLKANE